VRQEITAADDALPIHKLETMTSHLSYALAPARIAAVAVTSFGLLALLLAVLGLYAVVAYSVRRDTREIGVRIALGAAPANVLTAVVGRGMTLAAGGLVIGLGLGLVANRLLAGLLHGVAPTDPVSYGGAVLVLLVTAFVASLVPAFKATCVDPVVATRTE
jgi:ABC-type antimicrobial peptide transport system permease subunit